MFKNVGFFLKFLIIYLSVSVCVYAKNILKFILIFLENKYSLILIFLPNSQLKKLTNQDLKKKKTF